jgi:hypothetical protein
MKIPCIEEKCITWPLCRNSEVITCPKLNKFCCYLDENATSSEYMFKELNKFFPNLHSVFGDREKGSIAHVDKERLIRSVMSRYKP